MKSRRTVAVLAVLAVVGVAVAVFVHARGDSSPPSATETTLPLPPLDSARAEQLATSLAAGVDARFRDAVIFPSGVAIPPGTAGAFKALAPFSFDLETFAPEGRNTASVIAHTRDATWTVDLVLVGDRWMIVSTAPAP